MTVSLSLTRDVVRDYQQWPGSVPRVGEIVHFPGYCPDLECEVSIECIVARVQWFLGADDINCIVDLAAVEEIPEGFTLS